MTRSIVFDFDGVILDSVEVKTRAFEKLCAPYGGDAQAAMVSYHKENGGISRFVKFAWFFRTLLGKEITAAESEEWGAKFESLVFDSVLNSEFIAGANEFLQEFHTSLLLFVASGTPERELSDIIARRNLARFFKETGGSPRTKVEIVNSYISKFKIRPVEIVFVGDALSDFEAAKACGIPFIGIAADLATSPFPKGTRFIPDLTHLRDELELQPSKRP